MDIQWILRWLERYGAARNRAVDRESRIVTLTDDEAIALVQYVRGLEEAKR